jgi:hypothetical protein
VSRYHVYLAWLIIHLLLITAVSCRDVLESFTTAPVRHSQTNFGRAGVNAYLNLAGVENGYGFFAPNIPNQYELVFELHYPDGKIDYDVPHVASDASGLRVATLLDYMGQIRDDTVRRIMAKMLTYSLWREHPDAIMIRTFFGSMTVPSPSEFQAGGRNAYRVLYAYESRFRQDRQ